MLPKTSAPDTQTITPQDRAPIGFELSGADHLEVARVFCARLDVPDDGSVELLEGILREIPHLAGIAALPDLHYKSGAEMPTGYAVAVDGHIVPGLVGSPNCGMSLLACDVSPGSLSRTDIDHLFEALKGGLSAHPRDDRPSMLGRQELMDIFINGVPKFAGSLGFSPDDILRIEDRGSAFTPRERDYQRIWANIPAPARRAGHRNLKVLGTGNHFLEMYRIGQVIEPGLCARLDLGPDSTLFALHSDSGEVGMTVYELFSSRKEIQSRRHRAKTLARQLLYHLGKRGTMLDIAGFVKHFIARSGLGCIPADSDLGRAYRDAFGAAANYGFANRLAILAQIRDSIARLLGGPVRSHLVLDSCHDGLKRQVWRGRELFVHRNGAVQAMPPDHFPADHPFRRTGQPLFVPGALGTEAFLCVSDSGTEDALYSANHGSGRLLDKKAASGRFTETDVESYLSDHGIRLYRFGKDTLAHQHSGAFKNVRRVIETMRACRMARPVASLVPLAALKG